MVETFSYGVIVFLSVCFLFYEYLFSYSLLFTRSHTGVLIRRAIHGLVFILLHVSVFFVYFFALGMEPLGLLMLSEHSTPGPSPPTLPLFFLHLKSELIWEDVLREGNKGGEFNERTFTLV